jgi:hypothetical protein
VKYECIVIIHLLIEFYSHYIYRKRDIEHLLTLTVFFTCEEQPTRDPDTGYLTKAGYIPVIQDLIKTWLYCAVRSALLRRLRILMTHDMAFTIWYDFDVFVSPLYEITNFAHVSSNALTWAHPRWPPVSTMTAILDGPKSVRYYSRNIKSTNLINYMQQKNL